MPFDLIPYKKGGHTLWAGFAGKKGEISVEFPFGLRVKKA
jgi:hypothetical protein